jgi:hypothetical protein
MSWPDPGEPSSRLLLRSRAVVLLVDEVAGQPPPRPPEMRLQRLVGEEVVDLDWSPTVTLGGAVVFGGLMDLGGATPAAERYLLRVPGDGVLRPDRPAGYEIAIPADPTRWPVQVLVRLLPGPDYRYAPHTPVVRGLVLEQGPEGRPVPDAIVAASAVGGASARCRADRRGSFSLGLPAYRPAQTTSIEAIAPDGAVAPSRPLVPRDFETSVHLTVRR